jgi:hypothetical protein
MTCETYHYDPARLGFGEGAPRGVRWYKHLEVKLGSATRGAPLVASRRFAPGFYFRTFRTYVYVASSDNTVRAYNEDDLIAGNATPIWVTSLGTPTDSTDSNFDGSKPVVGITSTPVLDPQHDRMFVCSRRYSLPLFEHFSPTRNSVQKPQAVLRAKARAEPGYRFSIGYVMYSISLLDGTILQSAELVDAGAHDRNFQFDAVSQDQRGALNLVSGTVYATFAAFLGDDLGEYHGWLVGCEADNLRTQYFLPTTRTVLGGGCWGPGGAAAASDGSLFIATGNAMYAADPDGKLREAYFKAHVGNPPATSGDYFLSVLRVQKSEGRLEVADWFQPATLPRPNDYPDSHVRPSPTMKLEELDRKDLDFGSSSCLVLPEIDGRHLVVVSTKGFVFLLDRHNLGHSGSALYTEHVFTGRDPSDPTGGRAESHSAPAYLFANGEHLVFLTGGGETGGLVCFKVDTSGPHPTLSSRWKSDVLLSDACASPTVGLSTTDVFGRPEFHALVWIADIAAGNVHLGAPMVQAYDALTGQLLFNSLDFQQTQPVPDLPHYAPITCAGYNLYIGTSNGFAQFRAAPPFVRQLQMETQSRL